MSQTHREPERESTTNLPPSTPRWVKLFGIISLIVVLLVVVALLTGGEHGPGRHMPTASVTEQSEQKR